jgi:hypothetical protein
MGSLHGDLDGSPETIRQAVTAGMGVLEVTEATATEAAALQDDLSSRGSPVDHPDALVAAAAREHGGTFATAETQFWTDEVRAVLSVAAYDPY